MAFPSVENHPPSSVESVYNLKMSTTAPNYSQHMHALSRGCAQMKKAQFESAEGKPEGGGSSSSQEGETTPPSRC